MLLGSNYAQYNNFIHKLTFRRNIFQSISVHNASHMFAMLRKRLYYQMMTLCISGLIIYTQKITSCTKRFRLLFYFQKAVFTFQKTLQPRELCLRVPLCEAPREHSINYKPKKTTCLEKLRNQRHYVSIVYRAFTRLKQLECIVVFYLRAYYQRITNVY